MELYNHIDRVFNELKEMGVQDKTTVEELSKTDSLHYLGNHAIHSAIDSASITEKDNVLDIGSGLGGPARMLSHLTNCHVDAMELQKDLSETAAELTLKCREKLSVNHIHADFLSFEIEANSYTRLVSWLVFLHISDRKLLFSKCRDVLKPDGLLYVEDFFCKSPFTNEEKEKLSKDVYVYELPTWNELQLQLSDFEIVKMEDATSEWKTYVAERFQAYTDNMERHVRVHGEKAATSLLHFYSSIESLFQGGHLGGVRYTVKKL